MRFSERQRDHYLQLVGAAELVRLFGHIEKRRELRELDKHLALLAGGGFGPASARIYSDASRKVFELLVGLECLAAFAPAVDVHEWFS